MLRARVNGETFVSATMCRQQCVRNNVSSFARAFTRVYKCETEEKQHNGITCDLLTAEVIRVVYSLYED